MKILQHIEVVYQQIDELDDEIVRLEKKKKELLKQVEVLEEVINEEPKLRGI